MSFPKPSWWHRDQIWNTQAISCSSTSSSSTTYLINLPASVQSVWLDSVSCHPPVRWTNLDLWKKIVLLKLIETVLGIFISRKPFLCSFTCSVHPQKHTPKRAWRFFLGPWRYNIHIRFENNQIWSTEHDINHRLIASELKAIDVSVLYEDLPWKL